MMLIIKPYGRSVVKKGKRGIRQKNSNSDNVEPIAEFIEKHDKAVIAQWISVIDKIIAKPADVKERKTDDKKYKENKKQYDLMQKAQKLRKILGDATWKKLGDEKLLQKLAGTEEEKKKIEIIWNWKINATQPKQPKCIKGRWYEVFVGDIECNEENIRKNAAQIAEKIHRHLYTNAYRFPVKSDKGKGRSIVSFQPRCHNQGLIGHRASSIKENVLRPNKQKTVLYGEVDKETYIKKAGDFAGTIRKAILDEWGEMHIASKAQTVRDNRPCRDGRQSWKPQQQNRNTTEEGYKDRPHEIAARLLREARIKVFDGLKAFSAAKAKNPSLLDLHVEITETYKYLLKGRKKLDKKLEKILPENNEALFRLMEARQKNQSINHLIRLGKVIHYEASVKSEELTTENERDDVAAITCLSKEEIIKSHFWSSEGQTKIKQNEAFVRIWRSALAFATRTLKDWADPENKIHRDILETENIEVLIENFNNNYFDKKYKILFGKKLEANDQKALLEFSLKSISELRNAAFHFKGMGNFINVLGNMDEAVSDTLENNYKTDCKKLHKKRKEIMYGTHFHEFFGCGEIEKIWRELTSAKPSLLPLPKLKRVLERAEDAWKNKDKLQLPPYSTSDEREACEWARCQYTAIKLLYDGPFKNWLEEQQHVAINNYIKQAVKHTEQEAQRMNGKGKNKEHIDLITAKAQMIDKLKDEEKFGDFFSKLTAATATEMRVQNFYQSDGEAAKEQAEYIEKFKCDVVALAFEKYLEGIITDIKIFCQKERTEKQQKNFDYESLPSNQIEEFKLWQAKLYFLLHLIPVEEVGSLRQQLKKWEIVTRKSHGEEGREKDLLKALGVLNLYIDMHDAQFVEAELKSLSEEDKKTAKAFFENEADFKEIFPVKSDGSEDEHLPIRGLREMQRFGRGILHNVYEKHKITHESVKRWKELEKTIAEKQEILKRLHEEWVNSQNRFTKKSEYKTILETVKEYRHLQAQVMLQNHVHLHRLLMRILGRLVDFSGLWERDLYFVLLALFYHNDVTNIKEGVIKFLADGEIVRAIKKLTDDNLKAKIKCFFSNKDKIYKKLVSIRNDFAHFNMLKEENLPINLTKEVNNARQLMAYDRKLKNAVSKSIIDLLKRENIELEWCMGNDHKLEKLSSLVSAKASHLGGKQIQEELCSSHFIGMVTSLFAGDGQSLKSCKNDTRKPVLEET